MTLFPAPSFGHKVNFAFHLLPEFVGGQSGRGAADKMLTCTEPTPCRPLRPDKRKT